jgi:hypothetical protein
MDESAQWNSLIREQAEMFRLGYIGIYANI